MKKILLVGLVLGYAVCMGQQTGSFRLTGTVNIDSGTIRFYQVGQASAYPPDFDFALVPVVHGRFTITGNIDHPYEVMLLLDTGGMHVYVSRWFLIDTGAQSIVCDVQASQEIPGIHNIPMREFLDLYRSAAYQALDTMTNYRLQDSLERRYLYRYTEEHPDSWVALWVISHYLLYGYDEIVDSAFQHLSANIQHSSTGISIQKDLAQLSLTGKGKPFPKIRVYSVAGKADTLNYLSHHPKFILIDFWFSHCGPCIQQFPDYVQMVNTYQDKGFSMIGISSDASASDIALWKNLIQSNALNWVQYRTDKETMKTLHINLAPWNFLLDTGGRILSRDMSTKELADFLQKNLN